MYWLDRMVRSRHQLVERLALVFHDWWATRRDGVANNAEMLEQVNVFRAHGLGSFRAMTRAMTGNAAMLRFLAAQPDPVTLDRLATEVGLPRSTAYHLVNTMIEECFVVHLPEEHRYGLGVAAFEELGDDDSLDGAPERGYATSPRVRADRPAPAPARAANSNGNGGNGNGATAPLTNGNSAPRPSAPPRGPRPRRRRTGGAARLRRSGGAWRRRRHRALCSR